MMIWSKNQIIFQITSPQFVTIQKANLEIIFKKISRITSCKNEILKVFCIKLEKNKNIFQKINVELRCEKIIQIKGYENFENDQQNDQ